MVPISWSGTMHMLMSAVTLRGMTVLLPAAPAEMLAILKLGSRQTLTRSSTGRSHARATSDRRDISSADFGRTLSSVWSACPEHTAAIRLERGSWDSQKPGRETPPALPSLIDPKRRTISLIGSATIPPSTPLCASMLLDEMDRLAYTTPRMPYTTQGSFSLIQVELDRRMVSM